MLKVFDVDKQTGLYIGYHNQCNIKEEGSFDLPELTLDRLTNRKFLYISNNLTDWNPSRLKGDKDTKIYQFKILFKASRIVTVFKGEDGSFMESLKQYIDICYNINKHKIDIDLVILNHPDDLFEACILKPKKQVKAVIKL